MAIQDLLSVGLDVAAKTTLLLLLAGGAAFLLRKRSAAARHLAWSAALAGALVLPLVAPLAPEWTAPVALPLPLRAAAPVEAAAVGTPVLAPVAAGSVEALAAKAVTVDRLPPLEPLPARAPSASSAITGLQPVAVVLAAWALGALLLLAWTLRSHLRARALVRRSRELSDPELEILLATTPGGRRTRLLESAEIDVPLATGLLRPALVVPAGFDEWEAERRRVVLLHELAHVERGDCFAQLVGRAAVAVWWFHPLAWLALARLRREAEQAADDRVLDSGARPSEYAAHLLAVVRALTGRAPSASLSMAGSNVERRLLALLDPTRSRRRLSPLAVLGCTLAVACGVTALGGLRADAAPPRGLAARGSGSAHDDCPKLAGCAKETAHAIGHARSLSGWAASLADNSGPGAIGGAVKRIFESDGSRAFKAAMEHHEAGRYEESAAGFKEAFEAGYSEGTAAYDVACALSRLGRESEALDWLEIAFENGFSHVGLLDTDADLENLRDRRRFERLRDSMKERIDSGEFKATLKRTRAEKRIESLREERSEDASEWYQAGYDLHRVQDWKGAEEAWRRAVELGHSPANAHYNLACSLARLGRDSEALNELEIAVASGYSDAKHLLKDDDLASLRDRPRVKKLVETIGLLELPGDLNDLDEARENRADWERYTARTGELARANPNMARAWYCHGIGLLRTDRFDESAAAFRKAIETGHPEGISRWNEACALARAGRSAEALDALERSMELGFGSPWNLATDPDLESLREEPRFEALAEKHGGEGTWNKMIEHLHGAIERHVY